jgi:hypothetical protein
MNFSFYERVLQDPRVIEVRIVIFFLTINYLLVTFIKVSLAYQDKHVHHVFLVNEVIGVLEVHPVFQVKKENQYVKNK